MALSLTRKYGQSVILIFEDGTQCTITITGMKGNQVALSFDAPQSVNIVREEIYDGPSDDS